MTTPDLFSDTKPRRPRRFMMHVTDAGSADCSGDDAAIARFKCAKCGHETDWLTVRTITEGRRGIPCQKCNKQN